MRGKNRARVFPLTVGPYAVNTYVVSCPQTRDGIIIDPGGEDEKIVETIEANRIAPLYIINTHGHHDHVASNRPLAKRFGIEVYMHGADIAFFRERSEKPPFPPPHPKLYVDRELKDGDRLKMGTFDIRVLHTPGHTPGSICLLVGDCLFSGDTLFVGDAGRTDLPGGSLDALIHSIETRILPLPEKTLIYPGHDYGDAPFSTLEREITGNIYITDFISPSS